MGVKSGYVNGQIDVEQLEDYAKMIEILSDPSLDECTEFVDLLIEKGVNMKDFKYKVEVRYIVMPGKTNKVSDAVDKIEDKVENIIPSVIDKNSSMYQKINVITLE